MLHFGMASNKSSVRSIRLPKEVWAQLAEEAQKRATNVNDVLHSFAIVGLLKAAEGRASNPEQVCKAQGPKEKPAAKPAPVKSPANPPRVSLSLPTGVKLVDPKR